MKRLEQNYLSVVMVLNNHDTKAKVLSHLEAVHKVLVEHFKGFEIILVNNAVFDLDLSESKVPYILIDLFTKQNQQAALAAGVDMAIGDYIVEIPELVDGLDFNLMLSLYAKSQENHDFVFLTPKETSWSSRVFYKLLNRHFKHLDQENITSSLMVLSSRRGQNRIASLGKRVVNRNLSYLLSGLKTASLSVDVSYKNHRAFSENVIYSLDTLLYYTNVIMVFLQRLAYVFFGVFTVGLLYSIVLRLTRNIIEGWASLFVLSSFGFAGIFFILSIVVRYMYHILRNTNQSQDYIYKDVIRKS